ncbi:MAG: hypothetical protein BHW07_01160 [Clostridium sp. CAG_433_25_7]|nr:MAG: hypothetical protein BHW07_01160 [Clostridium sp. CAG_433_25_7]
MISSADLNVIVLKLEDKDDIPYNYKKTTFKYNDETIDGFVYGKSDFRVIYGVNAVTGVFINMILKIIHFKDSLMNKQIYMLI